MTDVNQGADWDRVALKAATARMGEFAWPTVIYGVVVVVGYWSVVALVALGYMNLWLGGVLSAVLTYMSYTTLHESVHGSITGRNGALRWLNDLLGYLSAIIVVMPMTVHRYEHLAHHRHTNEPVKDPDEVLSGSGRSPFHLVVNALKVLVTNYRFYLARRWPSAPIRERLVLMAELVAIWGPRLALVGLGFGVESLILFVVGTVAGLALTLYLFAYIVHKPHNKVGRYVDTSTFRAPGFMGKLVTWLWVYQNYHCIHHLFPKVPFYRYVEVFDEIEEVMVARGAPLYRITWRGFVPEDRGMERESSITGAGVS